MNIWNSRRSIPEIIPFQPLPAPVPFGRLVAVSYPKLAPIDVPFAWSEELGWCGRDRGRATEY
jgi:hypothetical protein